MKTIKQKLLHSKFAVLTVLLVALMLFVCGGFATKKVTAAEETFSEADFKMCVGAEVRTDGKDGIRFVASLGNVLPDATTYPNAKYYVMIVPKQYVDAYVTDATNADWYNAIQAGVNNDDRVNNKTIITMQAKPFYSSEVVAGEEGYYIRGTLSSVKYANINVEWFGMAYLTYTDSKDITQYIYAQIPETGANVRSLVYCASGYLNMYDYSTPEKAQEKEILTNFVAQGFNQANRFEGENKNDATNLEQALAEIETEKVNLLPEKTATWSAPAGMHAVYGAEDNDYATIDKNGVITGVAGDNNKSTTKNVTMKVLGTTYEKPVHVYTVTAQLPENVEIFSAELKTDKETFNNSVTLPVAQVDGEDVEDLDWTNDKESVATVSEGVVTADDFDKEWFAESKTTTVSYSFEFEEEPFTSNACIVQVSFPIAYQNAPLAYDLIQNVFNAENTLEQTTEDIKMDKLTGFTGTVAQFFEKNTNKSVLTNDGKTNANEYGAKEAGEKEFIVVSTDGYAYAVKATVVNYAIGNDTAELDYFFNSYKADTTESTNGSLYSTKGTYVILSDDVEDYVRSPIHDQSTYYAGTFDGRGHAIKYKKYAEGETVPTAAWTKSGMFGVYVSRFATIKNTAFIGLLKNSSAGGGLTNKLSGVVDNCYVEITMNGTTTAQGGVCAQNASGTIQNTIVYVTASKSSKTANKGTLCNSTTTSSVVENCFSIGVEGKIIHSTGGNEETTPTVPCSVNGLKEKIGTELPASYNSYWTYTETALSFGDTKLLTFTA